MVEEEAAVEAVGEDEVGAAVGVGVEAVQAVEVVEAEAEAVGSRREVEEGVEVEMVEVPAVAVARAARQWEVRCSGSSRIWHISADTLYKETDQYDGWQI